MLAHHPAPDFKKPTPGLANKHNQQQHKNTLLRLRGKKRNTTDTWDQRTSSELEGYERFFFHFREKGVQKIVSKFPSDVEIGLRGEVLLPMTSMVGFRCLQLLDA